MISKRITSPAAIVFLCTLLLIMQSSSNPSLAQSGTPAATQASSGGIPAELTPISIKNAAQVIELARFKDNYPTALVFSVDGKTLITAGGLFDQTDNKVVRLWDLATGTHKDIADTQVARTGASDIAVSPDGKTLAYSGTDTAIHLVDITSGKAVSTIPNALSVAYSADGKLIAARNITNNYNDLKTLIFEAASGKQVFSLANIFSPVFTPDGKQVVGMGGKIGQPAFVTVDIAKGKVVHSTNALASTFALSLNGKIAAAGGLDTLFIFDVLTGKQTKAIKKLTTASNSLALTPDGSLLAVGGCTGTVKEGRCVDNVSILLIDTASGKQLAKIEGTQTIIRYLAFTADGTLLASASNEEGDVHVWGVKP